MASRFLFLPEAANLPATNAPAPGVDAQIRPYLAYSDTTDEACDWTFVAPQGLTGALTAVISYYMASATSGAVRMQAAIEAITDGDAIDMDGTSSFDTANSNGETVPGTGQYPSQLSITMTNADSIAAGDLCRLRFNRDADGTSGTDDAAGDLHVLAIELRDAA